MVVLRWLGNLVCLYLCWQRAGGGWRRQGGGGVVDSPAAVTQQSGLDTERGGEATHHRGGEQTAGKIREGRHNKHPPSPPLLRLSSSPSLYSLVPVQFDGCLKRFPVIYLIYLHRKWCMYVYMQCSPILCIQNQTLITAVTSLCICVGRCVEQVVKRSEQSTQQPQLAKPVQSKEPINLLTASSPDSSTAAAAKPSDDLTDLLGTCDVILCYS